MTNQNKKITIIDLEYITVEQNSCHRKLELLRGILLVRETFELVRVLVDKSCSFSNELVVALVYMM